MKAEHIIIGTAGHIDHGKTAMIRALTGRDTDTLKEEKQRGISIDLGFTWFDLPEGRRAGVIDVPGHEKFLPNMLAGVCGMDLVLLVIALDEGMMPQTREHMDILEKLQVPAGILVLTKEDCVDAAWADMAEEEISGEIRGTMFASWPRQRISAVTGNGIEELKHRIIETVSKIQRTRKTAGSFRMPVDRVMTLKGLGTVIAGTVMEGCLRPEDPLMLYPSMQTVKIKSMQIHGRDTDQVSAGQRAALLLSGVKKDDIRRGFVAAGPDSLHPSRFLDVKIEMVKGTRRVLKNQSRVHLYIGTSSVLCRVVLLDREELSAGQTGYAQLRLEQELAVKKKDRFIVRFYSPMETIGGGQILEERPVRHKRLDEEALEFLKKKEENREEEILPDVLEKEEKRPLNLQELETRSGIDGKRLEMLLEELTKRQECAVIRGKRTCFYCSRELEAAENRRLSACLKEYHRRWPFRNGMEKGLLKSTGWKDWDMERFDAWLDEMERRKIICRQENVFRQYEFSPASNGVSEEIRLLVTKILEKQRFDLINMMELKPDDMETEMYTDILRFLEHQGSLVKISEEYMITPKLLETLIRRTEEYFQDQEILSYSRLRDLLGSNKRSARAVMAFLDARGITASCGRETERIYAGRRKKSSADPDEK